MVQPVRGIVFALVPISIMGGLAAYYIPPFLKAEEIASRRQWALGFDSALFSLYELLGFMGFGPGRNELRDMMISGGTREVAEGLVRPTSLGLVIVACIYLFILCKFSRKFRTEKFSPYGGKVSTKQTPSGLLGRAFMEPPHSLTMP